MVSSWTHPTCTACFRATYPDREPVRIAAEHRELEICCRCQLITRSGIYTCADPAGLACLGVHHALWDTSDAGLAVAEAPPRLILPRLGYWIRETRYDLRFPLARLDPGLVRAHLAFHAQYAPELADTRTDLPAIDQTVTAYLPTTPATQLEIATTRYPWRCSAWSCRALSRLHLWTLRGRVHARRH